MKTYRITFFKKMPGTNEPYGAKVFTGTLDRAVQAPGEEVRATGAGAGDRARGVSDRERRGGIGGGTVKIYVASSWRNDHQPEVVRVLREVGHHEVYDFKNPKAGDTGFHWRDVALERDERGYCLAPDLQRALLHPRAAEGFGSDFGAMKWADACVLLLPCGRSAHLEAGWMAGAGKPTIVLAPLEPIEPELMYGLLGKLCINLDEVLAELKKVSH